MKAIAIIEKGYEGRYHAYSYNLKTMIIGEGNTAKEAKEDFLNTAKEITECYTEESVPKELKNLSFEFRYDMSSFFGIFDFINMTKLAKQVGISDSLMRRYKIGEYISARQISKIETALHQIGCELANIKLKV